MNAPYATELALAKRLAHQAGDIMSRYFNGDQQVTIKPDGSPVTVADIQINRLVIDQLTKHTSDGIIGEEASTAEFGPGRRWLCDPIDGTKAFTLGLPTAMFSLALVIDGRPVLGVAYDPFLDQLYEGVVGQGSRCNGQPLHVSAASSLSGSRLSTTSNVPRLFARRHFLQQLHERGAKLAIFSGAVYKCCLIASGRLDAYIEPGIGAYDLAAAQVIVQEAGGRVTDPHGQPLDYSQPFHGAIVSNGPLHAELIKVAQTLP